MRPHRALAVRAAHVGETMPGMIDHSAIAQARELLRALHEHVDEVSEKLEAAEQRNRRARARGTAPHNHRQAAELRRDLYEAHRLIDGLHRRFPETTAHSRLAPREHPRRASGRSDTR